MTFKTMILGKTLQRLCRTGRKEYCSRVQIWEAVSCLFADWTQKPSHTNWSKNGQKYSYQNFKKSFQVGHGHGLTTHHVLSAWDPQPDPIFTAYLTHMPHMATMPRNMVTLGIKVSQMTSIGSQNGANLASKIVLKLILKQKCKTSRNIIIYYVLWRSDTSKNTHFTTYGP